jgi:transcriptional regulator with XRE-family HTH domain/Zn-dependent peptidase ImmA (M78 family)
MCDIRTMRITWADVGDRVRQARLARGMSQAQVAEFLRIQRTAVARIEAGERQVSALELFALADALGVSPGLLASTPPIAVTSRRAELSEDSDEASRRSARMDSALEEHARAVRQLAEDGFLPSARVEDPPPSMASPADAVAAARHLRSQLGLGKAPLEHLADVCDAAGLYVLVIPDVQGGASLLLGAGLGAAVIGGAEAPGRRRATAAHELGHHVLRDEYQSDLGVAASRDEREQLIDVFAAEFLLPEKGLRAAWQDHAGLPDDFSRLVAISAAYRTSWTETVKAAVQAGLVERSRQRELTARSPQRADFLLVIGHEPLEDLRPGDTSDT